MSFNITDEFLQNIEMADEKLKQEIAIVLFEQARFTLKKRFTLEEASKFAGVNLVDFKRLIVIANIRILIKQLNYSQAIFTSKAYDDSDNKSIDFGPIDWKNDLGEYCIYFKFNYTDDPLRIQLYIGHKKDNLDKPKIRERIIEVMNKQEYSYLVKPRKSKKEESRNMIYKKEIKEEINYKDGDIEDIMKKIQSFWQDFIDHDYKSRVDIITKNKKYIINGDK